MLHPFPAPGGWLSFVNEASTATVGNVCAWEMSL